MKATKKVAPKKIIKKTTVPKMQEGGSLPKAQRGGATYGPPRNSCGEKNKRKMKNLNNREKAGRILGGVGKVAAGTAAVVGAGAVAYKKNSKFKGAVDELKGKLGFNQKGGAVKKYAKGGSTKKDCPPGYIWDGSSCIKGPLYSTGAKLGVGAGALGLLGVGTSILVDKIKDMKAKKKAKKTLKELESKGTVAPRSLIKKK